MLGETREPGPPRGEESDLHVHSAGPDLVIAGSARSGTSFVAARLGAHPDIDPCAVKEPDYFSRQFDRGPGWYHGLFAPRRDGLLRLDASMSYTVPQHPEALARLAAAAPHAFVVYAVRDPLPRAFSHYRFLSSYFGHEKGKTFAQALRDNAVYLGAGDYSVWLPALASLFPPERLLVVPFPVMTKSSAVLSVLSERLGITPFENPGETVEAHRNEPVRFRHPAFRAARKLMVRSGAYPWVRRHVGADRLRRWRGRVTRPAETSSLDDALRGCEPGQLAELGRVSAASISAATRYLREQDERLALAWTVEWETSLAGRRTVADVSVDPASDRHAG